MSSQLLIVVSTFLAAFLGLGAVGIAYAGPFAVGAGLLAVFATQRRRTLPWASIGLGAPDGAGRFAWQAFLGLLAGWSAALAAMLLATRGLGWAQIDTARFAGLHGNEARLIGLLAISWTTAAFGEEVLFRGFLQSRLQALLGQGRHAGLLAVLAQAVVF